MEWQGRLSAGSVANALLPALMNTESTSSNAAFAKSIGTECVTSSAAPHDTCTVAVPGGTCAITVLFFPPVTTGNDAWTCR
ncbi:hypothetical protein [Nocardia sp. NBC_00403]|uniref:hypothetical protein n=1 Tax=Nocardia sp. NBC_00403 TaxID=2975990 RepID=UPI002E219722